MRGDNTMMIGYINFIFPIIAMIGLGFWMDYKCKPIESVQEEMEE